MFWKKEKEADIVVENKNNVNTILFSIIGVLVFVIAIMGGYMIWKMWNSSPKVDYEDLSIQVISDKRDATSNIDDIMSQITILPSIADADITQKDFSDEWVTDYLKQNGVTNLPLIVFSTNNFDTTNDPAQVGQNGQPMPKINSYLQKLPDDSYFLEIGSTYDPFVERSDRGFKVIDKELLSTILTEGAYYKWAENPKVVWLEYSDLECPYCAKLHKDGTPKKVLENYSEDVAVIFRHFPLSFHANAMPAAEITECLAEQQWAVAFYSLIDTAFQNENSNRSYLIEEAVKLWADEEAITSCLNNSTYTDKVNSQMKLWADNFGITGTPWNVLINIETGEYEILGWAYPYESFAELIERLK